MSLLAKNKPGCETYLVNIASLLYVCSSILVSIYYWFFVKLTHMNYDKINFIFGKL